MIDRRQILIGSLAAGLATRVEAQTAPPARSGVPVIGPADPTETIDLWPNGAAGMPATLPTETVIELTNDPGFGDRAVLSITRPRLVVFRPARPNGAALLIAPGGGYRRIVIDKGGYEMGRILSAKGWTVFVLFYRLPGEGWADRSNVTLADAQRAMRLIRSQAATYRIDPARVGVMGFSAGGHVCGDLATRFAASVYAPVDAADAIDARPAIAAPIYAVQSMSAPLAHVGSRLNLIGADASRDLERAHSTAANVSARTPPCFLVHAEDDPSVDVGNTLEFRAALKAAGVPVDTHLFAQGGHGFAVRGAAGKPAAAWPDLFQRWAATHGFG